jgi:hypothetical protein
MKKPKWYSIPTAVLIVLLFSVFAGCIVVEKPAPPSTPSTAPPPGTETAENPVIITFSASPTEIAVGESATLSWNVTGATDISIDQGIGDVSLNGSKEVSPTTSTVYTLTAGSATGSVNRTVAVNVEGNVGAARLALTEDDVAPEGFVFESEKELKEDRTISTYSISFTKGEEVLTNKVFVYESAAAAEHRYYNTQASFGGGAQTIFSIGTIKAFVVIEQVLVPDESEKYSIRFVKNNVYVEMGSINNLQLLDDYANIVESRIR